MSSAGLPMLRMPPRSERRALREDRLLVAGPLPGVEELPALHPSVRPLEHLARVRLEDHPLAGTEPPDVRTFAQVLGHLAQPVVLVALRLDVDLALGQPQRRE